MNACRDICLHVSQRRRKVAFTMLLLKNQAASTRSENLALNPASSPTSAMAKPASSRRARRKISILQNDLVGLYHRKSKDMLSSEQSMELKQTQTIL